MIFECLINVTLPTQTSLCIIWGRSFTFNEARIRPMEWIYTYWRALKVSADYSLLYLILLTVGVRGEPFSFIQLGHDYIDHNFLQIPLYNKPHIVSRSQLLTGLLYVNPSTRWCLLPDFTLWESFVYLRDSPSIALLKLAEVGHPSPFLQVKLDYQFRNYPWHLIRNCLSFTTCIELSQPLGKVILCLWANSLKPVGFLMTTWS